MGEVGPQLDNHDGTVRRQGWARGDVGDGIIVNRCPGLGPISGRGFSAPRPVDPTTSPGLFIRLRYRGSSYCFKSLLWPFLFAV